MILRTIRKLCSDASGNYRIGPLRVLVLLVAATTWLANGSLLQAWAANERRSQATFYSNSKLPPPDPDLPLAKSDVSAGSAARLLLPDLRTLPPSDLEIETLPDGSRELRLSNTIWNSGKGALELEGKVNTDTRQTRVEQHVHARVGSELNHLVGEFVWHPTHDHWHFEEFSLYELWTLTPGSGLETVVSSSDKVSYCVIDTDIIDPENPGYTERRRYFGCGQALQGLSAGWGDEYKSFLDGQSIQLAGVKDGYYALMSTANPNAILLEADYENNAAILYLEIQGNRVGVLTHEQLIELRCEQSSWC